MKLYSTLIFLLVCFFAKSQNDSIQFPQDFYGTYTGNLHISDANGKQTIAMEFHLNKTDSIGKYKYMLVYFIDGKRKERNYSLIEKDVAKGDYLVDENNGIVLNAKLVENTLYFVFEVQNNLITTTERFYKDSMDFEVTMTNSKQKTATRTEGEDSIDVNSYLIGNVQKANLIKQ